MCVARKKRGWTGRRWLRGVLGLLSLALFGMVLYWGGVKAWRQVLRADPLWLGVAFACTAALTYVSAARWGLIANAVAGMRVGSTRVYYHALMMGKTVGLVLPESVGVYAVGPLTVKAEGQSSFKLAFGTLFLDKLFDLGLSGVLLLPTAAYALRLVSLEGCAALFVALFIALGIGLLFWYNRLVALAFRTRDWIASRAQHISWANRLLQGRAGQALLALQAERIPVRRIALLAYAITLFRYLLMAARFAFVSRALRVGVPPLLLFVGIPIAQLGLLLAVTPGALGTMEAGWWGVLLLAGLPRQDITTFLIGQRAALFVFIFVLGLLSYLGNLILPFKGRRGTDNGRQWNDT